MRTIVILGNFGATNIGDEALLESMLHLFRSEADADTLRLHVMTSDPADTLRRYDDRYQISASPLIPAGFRTMARLPKALLALRKLRKIDHIVFGGGGLFTDQPSKYPVLLWWLQLQGLRLVTKAPVHIVGQSFGPLKSQMARRMKAQVLRQVAQVAVRDESSLALAKELHAEKAVMHLPDLAFFYPLPEMTEQTPHEGLRVAISLRPWHDTAAWMDAVEHWALHTTKPLELLLIPMQTTREEDVSILSALRDRLKHIEGISIRITYVSTFAELATTLHSCDLAIGQRLHFLLCSLMVGTPAVGLAYSEKVRSLLKDSGVPLLETPDETALTEAVTTSLKAGSTPLAAFHERAQEHRATMADLLHGRN